MPEADLTALPALVERLRREVEQARFGGADPELAIAADDSPATIVAKTLAAERLNAPLRLGGALLPLQEDVAEGLYYRGLTALRYWRFAQAQDLFEQASARTASPVLQQRLALYRAAAALLARIVLAEPGQSPRPLAEERALDLVDTLDALSEAERAHYAAELRRLLALRAQGASDPYLQTVHCLLRARLALGGGDETLGLGWLLRAAALNAERLTPNPYLADLLARARARLRGFLGDAAAASASARGGEKHGEDTGEATEQPEPDDVRASELLAALASHLDLALGGDVQGDAARYSVTAYHEPNE
jgi:hypothetical protein